MESPGAPNRPLVNALARVNVEGVGTLDEFRSPSTRQSGCTLLSWEEFTSSNMESDVHFQCCAAVTAQGVPLHRRTKREGEKASARLRKDTLASLRAEGFDIRCTMYVADFDWKDNEHLTDCEGKHWTPSRQEWMRANLATLQARLVEMGLGFAYLNYTHHGLRFVHVYDEPVSCEDQEHIMAAMIAVYARFGLMIDTAVGDWTRVFRGPRVKRSFPKDADRPDERTWEQDWFYEERTDETMCSAKVLALPAPVKKTTAPAKAPVPMYEGDMPTPEECIALFEEPTGRGGTARKTELYKSLKTRMQRIDDPHLYAALVHQMPYPFEHGQVNTDMTRVVGSLCGRLYGEPYMDGPEPIFAMLLPGAEELPTDNPWINILWSMCVRMWTGEAAQHKAKEIEQEKAEEEQRSRMEELLDNLRALYPSTPIDQAWAMQHAIAKKGRDHYLLRLDGTYGTMAYEESTLPNAVRDSGMEFLVKLEEMRGKSLVYLSGRDLVKMHGFSLAGIGHSAFVSGAVLRFEGAGPTLVLQAYQRRRIPCRFHQEVDDLLHRSFGAQLKLFYLWVGEALAFDETGSLPLLLVIGKTGGCKTLVTAGLGHAMAGREVVKASKASQRFNAALLHSPIVHHEEEFHTARGEDSPAQAIRTMIGGSSLNTVERKGRDVGGGLEVQLRVIVTMNSKERAVRTMIGDQDLEPDDIAAVARRVLVIETEEGVDDWLEDYAEKHGRRYTDRWLEDDKLPEHLLWCYENRDRLRGELEDAGILPPNSKHGRFLLPSNAHDLFRAQDAESEVPDGLLCSVAQMFTCVPTAVLDSGSGEALRCGPKLLLLTGPLVDRQVDDRFGSTRKRRVAAVDRLCSSKPDIPWRPVPGAKKSRWRELDTEFVLRLLVARGFEDVADDLAAVRGEPDRVTDQGAA